MSARVIKTNWKGSGAGKPLAEAMRTLGTTFQNARMEDGSCLQKRAGLIIPMATGGSSFPWSKLCFGYTLSGATVTIMAGEVQWGLVEIIVAETGPITLTLDYSYIGVETNGSTASIIGPSTARADFRTDSTYRRTWLYQFRLSGGRASLYRIGHMGNWDINGSFAP
jgi:hypothetical protein